MLHICQPHATVFTFCAFWEDWEWGSTSAPQGIILVFKSFENIGLWSREYTFEDRNSALSKQCGGYPYLIYSYPKGTVEFETCPDAVSQGSCNIAQHFYTDTWLANPYLNNCICKSLLLLKCCHDILLMALLSDSMYEMSCYIPRLLPILYLQVNTMRYLTLSIIQ